MTEGSDISEASPIGRPVSAESLMSEPILATPIEGDVQNAEWLRNWDFEHESPRFYVAHFLDFLRTGAAHDMRHLYDGYGAKAVKAVQQTAWIDIQGPRNSWDQISYGQFRAPRLKQPMMFHKCALVILACELATRDAYEDPARASGKLWSIQELYATMKIVPACYNLNGFHEEYVAARALELGVSTDAIAEAIGNDIGQPWKMVRDLSMGHTVTRQTAFAVKRATEKLFAKSPAKEVRSVSGKRLGLKAASAYEVIPSLG